MRPTIYLYVYVESKLKPSIFEIGRKRMVMDEIAKRLLLRTFSLFSQKKNVERALHDHSK